MTQAGYEYFDVAADVGVRAWGATTAEAFAQAAIGVFALTIAPGDVQLRETREVRAQADSVESLLVHWINECLYVHEIEGFAVGSVDVTTLTESLVHGFLQGEPIDARRHRLGTVVKAATYHEVRISVGDNRTEIRLVVDV